MRHIRLFGKTTISFKSTQEKAPEEAQEVLNKNVFHEIQMPNVDFKITNRKLKPVNVEISFYDLDEIKAIYDYYKNESKK